jgi:hypothetical protein
MSTITPTQSLQSPAPLALPAVYRFTEDEFERIADSLDNDQVELIDGYIDHQVEVYTDPTAAGYGSRVVYAQFPSAQLAPVVIDGVEVGQIAVSDILP